MELPACPVETTLMLIGDKWKVLILRDLMEGTKRFGELKKSIGTVSQKVLTAQLRDMEAKGLLTRTVYAEVPPRVEYTLTETGRSLKPFSTPWSSGGRTISAETVARHALNETRPGRPRPEDPRPDGAWRHARRWCSRRRPRRRTPRVFCGFTAAATLRG